MNSIETFIPIELPVEDVSSDTLPSSYSEVCEAKSEVNKDTVYLDKINNVINELTSLKSLLENKKITPALAGQLLLTVESYKKSLKIKDETSNIKKVFSKEQFGGVQSLEEGTKQALVTLDKEIKKIEEHQKQCIINSTYRNSEYVLKLFNFKNTLKQKTDSLKVKFLENKEDINKNVLIKNEFLKSIFSFIFNKDYASFENNVFKIECNSIYNNLKKFNENENELLNISFSIDFLKKINEIFSVCLKLDKVNPVTLDNSLKTEYLTFKNKVLENYDESFNALTNNSLQNEVQDFTYKVDLEGPISTNHIDLIFYQNSLSSEFANLNIKNDIEIINLDKEHFNYYFEFIENFCKNSNEYLQMFLDYEKNYSSLIHKVSNYDIPYSICTVTSLLKNIYEYNHNVCLALIYLISSYLKNSES